MMRKASVVRLSAAALLLLGIAFALPAMSATGPGSLRLTSPAPNTLLGDETLITWAYTYGTDVTSTSHVNVMESVDNIHWRTLAYRLPLKSAYVWDTTGFATSKYWLRVQIDRRTINSTIAQLVIDRAAPSVTISEPAEGESLGVTGLPISTSVVSGSTKLVADATDDLTGIADVVWYIDDTATTPIGHGSEITYNFDQVLGQHNLFAVAFDGAGNWAISDARTVLAVPGPVGPLQNLGLLPAPPPSDDPVPSPSPSTPSAPSVDVPSLPVEVPSVGPLP